MHKGKYGVFKKFTVAACCLALLAGAFAFGGVSARADGDDTTEPSSTESSDPDSESSSEPGTDSGDTDTTWQNDFYYTQDADSSVIKLTSYKGGETEVTVPAKAIIGGAEYNVVIAGKGASCWGAITNLSFDSGVALDSDDASGLFDGCSNLVTLDLSGIDTSSVTTMYKIFNGCTSLKNLYITNLNTSSVTNMAYIFSGCQSLETFVPGSNFDTSNVTNMAGMFDGCSSLTSLDLTNLKTENVTSMRDMFNGCSSLSSLDLSQFNTAKVNSMINMFAGCSGLSSLNLASFDTSSVTSMAGMFSGCSGLSSLTFGSTFTTGLVTDMSSMFSGCSNLTALDLSGFNTSNVEKMDSTFYGCSGLSSLDLSGFDMGKVSSASNMFSGCSNLTELETPTNVHTDVILPANMYDTTDTEESTMTMLPKNSTESQTLSRKADPVPDPGVSDNDPGVSDNDPGVSGNDPGVSDNDPGVPGSNPGGSNTPAPASPSGSNEVSDSAEDETDTSAGNTVTYPILSGGNTSVIYGATVEIRVDCDISKFRGLYIDGVEISSSEYSVRSGSTIVTLPSALISRLSAGNHTVRVQFSDGYSDSSLSVQMAYAAPASTSATKSTGGYDATYKTGQSPVDPWIVLLIVGLCGAAVCFAMARRSKSSES